MEISNPNIPNPIEDKPQNKNNGVNKKLFLFGILALIIILIAGLFIVKQKSSNVNMAKQQLQQQFETVKSQYEDAKAKGYDVSEAERLGQEAMQAYNKKDYKKANQLLSQALEVLSGIAVVTPLASALPTGTPPSATALPINSGSVNKEEAKIKFSQVKITSLYRYVTDGIDGRTTNDVINIFKETKTDFIFQGLNRQNPLPENCSVGPKAQQSRCQTSSYSYEHFKNAIAQIKKEMPDVIFGGGFLAEFLDPYSWNEITGKTYTRDELWAMAADPSKWGISKSKDEFQTELAIRFGWTKQGEAYDPKSEMRYYFPDITNPGVKELFLSWAKGQIDIGVDSIWIDGLYGQAALFEDATGNINHKAVKDSYEASSDIIDEIHKYGLSKGKYIYVISWGVTNEFTVMLDAPYAAADFDGIMTTVGAAEIRNLKMNEKKWDEWIKRIKERFGDTPIFARIDYGDLGSPLVVFSQEITKDQANQFLRIADEYFERKGIKFIYPVHGGNMGNIVQKGKTLSFGKYDWYDSLAPEFDTYDTIKDLANKKAE